MLGCTNANTRGIRTCSVSTLCKQISKKGYTRERSFLLQSLHACRKRARLPSSEFYSCRRVWLAGSSIVSSLRHLRCPNVAYTRYVCVCNMRASYSVQRKGCMHADDVCLHACIARRKKILEPVRVERSNPLYELGMSHPYEQVNMKMRPLPPEPASPNEDRYFMSPQDRSSRDISLPECQKTETEVESPTVDFKTGVMVL